MKNICVVLESFLINLFNPTLTLKNLAASVLRNSVLSSDILSPLFSLPVPWIHSLFGFSCNTFALFYFLPGIICLLKRNMKKLKNTFLSSNFIVLACLIFISSSSFRTEFQIFLIHGDSVLSQKYFLQIPWQLSVPDNIAMVYRMWILGRMFLPYKTANL